WRPWVFHVGAVLARVLRKRDLHAFLENGLEPGAGVGMREGASHPLDKLEKTRSDRHLKQMANSVFRSRRRFTFRPGSGLRRREEVRLLSVLALSDRLPRQRSNRVAWRADRRSIRIERLRQRFHLALGKVLGAREELGAVVGRQHVLEHGELG